jgi:hypothetical protein
LALLLKAGQGQEDEGGLLREEHPERLPVGLGADLMTGRHEPVLRHILHGGDDRRRLVVDRKADGGPSVGRGQRSKAIAWVLRAGATMAEDEPHDEITDCDLKSPT